MTNSALMKRLRSSFSQTGALGTTNSSTPFQSAAINTQPATAQESLAILDTIISDIELANSPTNQPLAYDSISPVIPQVALQQTDTFNQTASTTTTKEKAISTASTTNEGSQTNANQVESNASLSYVEQEKNPELPVEVDGFLQTVTRYQDQTPSEIVIADGSTHISNINQPVKRPVIVLPITLQQEKIGSKKSLVWSFRWLIEWSKKIIKMFTGKVIYKQAVTNVQ